MINVSPGWFQDVSNICTIPRNRTDRFGLEDYADFTYFNEP